jgi:hypothetical protein|tara:strand:+ start:262 stop:561 length:300 start_codon:yes stop_codon:yes gene_type:complete
MRKKKNKSKTQIESEKRHAAFLARVGYTPKKHRLESREPLGKPSVVYHRVGNTVPCSNTICAITYKPKKSGLQNYTVAPAYNKGAYQLITKGNVKDIGK